MGEGGIAVIRLSGAEALIIGDAIFTPIGKTSHKPSLANSHTLHYGRITKSGKIVDEVMIAVMRAPRTFTREDVLEISCHGGMLPAKAVLQTVLDGGARLAEPGEFTRRAFLNGRIDLAQAEAVADLIHSRTELAMTAASEQLAGKLSQRINILRDDLVATTAHVEAHIDFPDEDITPDTRQKLVQRLEGHVRFMRQLLDTADEGRLLRNGVQGAIVGRPNAGKSSLLNQLLGQDRAIVSPVAGTTRDTIEETANIRGVPVLLVDTAGLRKAGDAIEAEGIRRTLESVSRSEFVLHVLDSTERIGEEDARIIGQFSGKKGLIVWNKSDLAKVSDATELLTNTKQLHVSCATGQGIEKLKDAIKELVWSGSIQSEMMGVMINSRHQNALVRSIEAVGNAVLALKDDRNLELAAMDLRIGLNAVGEIVGKTTTEDILDSIFSQFCIGK
jgi:tRNA modification GTPase